MLHHTSYAVGYTGWRDIDFEVNIIKEESK